MQFCLIAIATVLLITAAHAGSDKTPNQVSSKKISTRIVGGEEAGAWPWMTALIDNSYNSLYDGHSCGGSLIHPNWVVTAAHCVYDGWSEQIMDPGDIDVVVGIHNLEEDTGERIGVKQIILHPQYDYYKDQRDIALLELKQASSVRTIPLIGRNTAVTGKEAVTIGWGATNPNGWNYPSELRQVTVPIVSNETCQEAYINETITDDMICAGYEEGKKDSCSGDSGGPLIVQDGDIWKLAGIVSWGEGCALAGYYGVYANVQELSAFIAEHVPFFTLSLPENVTEGDGMLRGKGIVSLPEAPENDLQVHLSSDNSSEITVSDTATILAGQTSATFDITISDDSLLNGSREITVTATADQITTAGTISINDNETAVLHLSIPENATEGDGLLPGRGTVSMNKTPEVDIIVSLNSDDTSEVSVPGKVIIPAGQLSAVFDMEIIYDGKTDDTQTVNISASVEGWTSGSDTIAVAHYDMDFFTEAFEGKSDLANQTLIFIPDSSGSFYQMCLEKVSQKAFPTNPAGGTVLSLKDDDYKKISLTGETRVSFYGVSYSSFYVGSDGDISFVSGDNTMDRTLGFHFQEPRISALLDDLNPEKAGEITWKQAKDKVVISYQNIPEFGENSDGGENSFQIEMFVNGMIRITYLDISAEGAIAGLSEGGGIPDGFVESNLNAYELCGDSGTSDLKNVVLILEVLAGLPSDVQSYSGPMDGDGKLGMEEAIFVLRGMGSSVK